MRIIGKRNYNYKLIIILTVLMALLIIGQSSYKAESKTVNTSNLDSQLNSIYVSADAIFVDDNTIFIYCDNEKQVYIFDITEISKPKQISNYKWKNSQDDYLVRAKMIKYNDLLVLAGSYGYEETIMELIILDISNLDNPLLLSEYYSINKTLTELLVKNDQVFISFDLENQGYTGFEILDITDRSNIQQISEVIDDTYDEFWRIHESDVGVHGNTVYLLANDTQINVYNITNSSNITKINNITFEEIHNFEIHGNYLYTNFLDILNITNPLNLTFLEPPSQNNTGSLISRFGDRFVVSGSEFYIQILTVSNSFNPVLSQDFSHKFLEYQVSGMGVLDVIFFYNDILFIQMERLHMYDITIHPLVEIKNSFGFISTIINSILMSIAFILVTGLILFKVFRKKQIKIQEQKRYNFFTIDNKSTDKKANLIKILRITTIIIIVQNTILLVIALLFFLSFSNSSLLNFTTYTLIATLFIDLIYGIFFIISFFYIAFKMKEKLSFLAITLWLLWIGLALTYRILNRFPTKDFINTIENNVNSYTISILFTLSSIVFMFAFYSSYQVLNRITNLKETRVLTMYGIINFILSIVSTFGFIILPEIYGYFVGIGYYIGIYITKLIIIPIVAIILGIIFCVRLNQAMKSLKTTIIPK